MKRTAYTSEQSALNKLTNNRVLSEVRDKWLILRSGKGKYKVAVGIKLWGAIDYLINRCGYKGWTFEKEKEK